MKDTSGELGQLDIGRLLLKQAVPASVGFLVMSIYSIVDTIYVGHWVGSLGIAAITVVMPLTFLISSIGMAVGVGGASIISRALGSGNREKAYHTFGNQIGFTLSLSLVVVFISSWYDAPILQLFGGHGEILPYAQDYFEILVPGIPFLAWAMMANNVIRAEGKARWAMYTLIIPAIINIILDPIFIIWLDMGLKGAAWATLISYLFSAGYTCLFFFSKWTEMKFYWKSLIPDLSILKELFSIGSITLARQGSVSLLTVVLNHSLFSYGGEMGIAIYGVINRISLFALFPVIGVVQGFLPIAGYNYGAKNWDRVKEAISVAYRYGTGVCFLIFLLILAFAPWITAAFTQDEELLNSAPFAMRMVFLAVPLVAVQLIGSAYFQAIGKAVPALLLTLTKQGFFLIPLVSIFPLIWGIDGIWYSFPVADVLSASVTWWYVRQAVKKQLPQTESTSN
ncbi:MATE family efflux transporter [bacterium SCSIO 12741]|nr:MATE family efflux transporter [bacterium SCSIO 12741]